mgnify:CR=1 FL=1
MLWRVEKAMALPSGDHLGVSMPSLSRARVTTSPPTRTGATWRDAWVPSPVPRLEVKARRAPSGDHDGFASLCSPDVNGRGDASPSTGASQIWLRYSLVSASGNIRFKDNYTLSIGIENADGTDALSFGFFSDVLTDASAFRYTEVPSGLVTGTVTDANDASAIVKLRTFIVFSIAR